jgi:hypothetical protein
MAGIDMPDPDGVRRHGTRFHNAGEAVHNITDRMSNMQMSELTLGSEWQEHGTSIRDTLPKLQMPWRRLGDFHKEFGTDLRDSADLVQGVDQEHADSLKKTRVPDGEI